MGSHPVLAANVHIGQNKDKMLFILYTSKTHSLESKPQEIKISSKNLDAKLLNRHFCPFNEVRSYCILRGNYVNPSDPFFVFRDNSPIRLHHV